MAQAITRRRLLRRTALAVAATLGVRPGRARAQGHDAAAGALAAAAQAFLGQLPAGIRRRATFPFGDAERLNWGYVPRRREGVPLKDLPASARTAAHELLKAALSATGYTKALDVIRLEGVLRQRETFGAFLRDPENYAVSVFGTPGPAGSWGFRVEGHHLSLNFTVAPGRAIAATPAFLGANPATVPSGALQGLRALGREEDLGRALARSLDPTQRARMLIATSALGDIVAGPGRVDSLKVPAGIPLGALTAAQRETAGHLLDTYVQNMRTEIAEDARGRLQAAGIEQVHFAWAGSLDPGQGHYYRLHGPTVLIEYDNTQNDANHAHSVWHDPRNSFGADLLRAHYDQGHGRPA